MDIALHILSFVLGTVAGSFLNVCIYRIPARQSIISPPSHCPSCDTRLTARDLVPLFSYILLRGKCRYCGTPVSLQYPGVELVTGILFVAAIRRFGLTLDALAAAVFFSLLVVVSVIDIRHRIIPNGIVLTGLISGIPLNFLSREAAYDGLVGFLLGGGILLLVAVLSRGGMGGGDIKLAAMAGIYLGWQQTLLMLLLSFLLGSVVGVAIVWAQRKTLKEAIPFGPFLSAGGVMALLWGEQMISWYLTLLQ